MAVRMERVEVKCPKMGKVAVYTHGTGEVPIMTVHDLGCNQNMWQTLVSNAAMEKIVEHSRFYHVVLPGQEDNSISLLPSYEFPRLVTIAEELPFIMDHFEIHQAILLGEGAGANIIARTALAAPNRVLGIVLIHCTGTTAGFMETVKDKLINWKLDIIGMNPTAEAYLTLHRFGSFEEAETEPCLRAAVSAFDESLRQKINAHNLKLYVDSFLHRTNITEAMKELKVPVLFVTGEKASFNHTVHTLFTATILGIEDRRLVDFLEVANVANVLTEQPAKFAESFQYFLQGIGLMATLPMSHLGEGMSLSHSMEDYDRPRLGSASESSR